MPCHNDVDVLKLYNFSIALFQYLFLQPSKLSHTTQRDGPDVIRMLVRRLDNLPIILFQRLLLLRFNRPFKPSHMAQLDRV